MGKNGGKISRAGEWRVHIKLISRDEHFFDPEFTTCAAAENAFVLRSPTELVHSKSNKDASEAKALRTQVQENDDQVCGIFNCCSHPCAFCFTFPTLCQSRDYQYHV